MEKLGGVVILILVLIIGIFLAAGYANEQSAKRDHAEAELVTARAQATAITSAAQLPVLVVGVMGVIGLAVVAMAVVVVVMWRRQYQVTERQIIYLPIPGQSRMQTLQAISEIKTIAAPNTVTVWQPQKTRAFHE